ncbi:hypothetical protein BGX38DRAFT_443146 [Terfezia claveryi]|nr:hypothetical protein BGX38DRAFT_443146 [Terfezia claveryi]
MLPLASMAAAIFRPGKATLLTRLRTTVCIAGAVDRRGAVPPLWSTSSSPLAVSRRPRQDLPLASDPIRMMRLSCWIARATATESHGPALVTSVPFCEPFPTKNSHNTIPSINEGSIMDWS